jgi:hypothetical protein
VLHIDQPVDMGFDHTFDHTLVGDYKTALLLEVPQKPQV